MNSLVVKLIAVLRRCTGLNINYLFAPRLARQRGEPLRLCRQR